MLVYFRFKLHLRCDPCVYAGQFSCQDTHPVQRRPCLLTADPDISRSGLYISKGLRHNAGRIIPVSQFPAVEIIKIRDLRHRAFRERTLDCLHPCQITLIHAQPSVLGPSHLLDRRLPPQRTPQFRNERARRVVKQIYFAVRCLYIASMTGFLKDRIRIIVLWLQMVRVLSLIGHSGSGSKDRILRIFLVRPPHIPGTSHGNTMIISGSALSAHDIIPPVVFGKMRCLDTSPIRASSPDALRISNDLLFFRR